MVEMSTENQFEKQAADSLALAKKALDQRDKVQASAIETVKTTLEMSKFTRDKVDSAILQVAAGDNLGGLMTLGDLRIRFDKFIKTQEANLAYYAGYEVSTGTLSG